MSDIPESADSNVAAMAIAWGMVKATRQCDGSNTPPDLEQMRRDYIETYKAIVAATRGSDSETVVN